MAANDLYGFFPTMSQPLTASPQMWNIPERLPGALPVNQDPTSGIPLNFQPGVLSQLAYQMAGSPKRGPFQSSILNFSGMESGYEPVTDTTADLNGVLQAGKTAA